ncbi:RraA family protein [Microbacterium sp. CPCC 204701]|uniref:RraA family protein n=1 Tax=Microbacterium sp. CPCC 204701 TaxID=2493084 RepID=UPI000FD9E94C|nr:RraA family protein [Microbacterium sp. CPCC 204701]
MSVAADVQVLPAPAVDRDLLDTLRGLDLPTFGHIVEDGVARGIHRVAGGETLTVGRVVTVKLVATDSRLVHYMTKLVEPGDFVVVDNGHNTTHASIGGGVAGSLAARGAVGVAVEGTVTDVVELRGSGMVVLGRGLAPFTTRTQPDKPVQGGINVPVTIGGATVRPGMIAMADENGVLFAEPAVLEGLIERVRQMMAWEPPAMARVRAGETTLAELILPGDDLAALDALASAGRSAVA